MRLERGGAVGFGEVAPAPDQAVDADRYVAEASRLVAELDAADPRFVELLDERRPPARLRCGITTAWFAATAAAMGRSLAAHLAEVLRIGRTPAELVPVNGLVTEAEPADAAARAATLVRSGMTTVKVKCTDERDLDLSRVSAIRDAVPGAALRLDPNESWSPQWVLEHLEAMAAFDLDYVEQPLPRTTPLATMAQLRAASPVPLAADQAVLGLDEVDQLLEARAADVLILKAPRLGGPDRTVEAVGRAARRRVPCTVTASLETAVGLSAALHCASMLPDPVPACGLGTARFLQRDVGAPPPISRGWMTVPKTPGLGIAVSWHERGTA